jgi:hypothetical protein
MVADEKYVFTSETKKKLITLGLVGIVLFALGVFMAMRSEGDHGQHKKEGHASNEITKHLVASTDDGAAAEHGEHHGSAATHHGSPTWLKRIYTSLWQNNIFFAGIGIIGLFFIAIQYAAQAGGQLPLKGYLLQLAIGYHLLVFLCLFFGS